MRRTFLALVLILGLATPSAQGSLYVVVKEGVFRTAITTASAPYATGEPWVSVPARSLRPGVVPAVTEFRVRAWQEGEGARVVVFALIPSAGGGPAREEQIASLLAPVGQLVDVRATEKYGARPLTVIAYREPMGPYIVEGIKIAPSALR